MNKYERHELLRLKRENAKLRRENEYLNHRIEKLSPKEVKNIPREQDMFFSAADVDKYSNYWTYIFGKFKLSTVYRIYDKIYFALRKVMLATRIYKYLPIVLGVIGILFQSVIAIGSLVVLMAALLIISLVFAVVSVITFSKHKRSLLHDVSGRKLYFLYPAKKPKKDGVFYETMQAFAHDGVVFAVTPSFTLCGFGLVRKVSENVYFIHTSFYYHFKKDAIAASGDVVKVY